MKEYLPRGDEFDPRVFVDSQRAATEPVECNRSVVSGYQCLSGQEPGLTSRSMQYRVLGTRNINKPAATAPTIDAATANDTTRRRIRRLPQSASHSSRTALRALAISVAEGIGRGGALRRIVSMASSLFNSCSRFVIVTPSHAARAH